MTNTIEYIKNRSSLIQENISVNSVDVDIQSEVPDNVNISKILTIVKGTLPKSYFKKLDGIVIADLEEFERRNISAKYSEDDNKLYLSADRQDNNADMLDDVYHEIGHHVETLYPEQIYGDKAIQDEFLLKRKQLYFELASEGYNMTPYNLANPVYNKDLDDFFYKRVGKRMMNMVTAGISIRPYAMVSLKEYFAVGFEQYYLGNDKDLHKISPVLYKKISELHNLARNER
tara:strand:+ start:1877 stop:2569 length:693 start_codon:yes stop_codon:yes gene_type:complete